MNVNYDTGYLTHDRRRKLKLNRIKKINKLLGQIIVLLIIGLIICLYYYLQYKPIEKEQLPEPSGEKIVLIESKVDWTPQRIEQEINKVFPDAPIMVAVANCEGVRKGVLVSDAYNSKTGDSGVLQVNEYFHKKRYEKMGLDMMKVRDNLAYGRILYDERGLTPWSSSKSCWGKQLKS